MSVCLSVLGQYRKARGTPKGWNEVPTLWNRKCRKILVVGGPALRAEIVGIVSSRLVAMSCGSSLVAQRTPKHRPQAGTRIYLCQSSSICANLAACKMLTESKIHLEVSELITSASLLGLVVSVSLLELIASVSIPELIASVSRPELITSVSLREMISAVTLLASVSLL